MAIDRDGQDPSGYMGINPLKHPALIRAKRAPLTTDRRYKIGSAWVDTTNLNSYILAGVSAGSATWNLTSNQTSGDDASSSVKGIASFDASDFTVTSGNVVLNEAIMSYATVSITAAQVKALETTQIELVAAPGAGKVLKFMGASLKLDYGSEVFAEAGDNLAVKYTDDSGVQVSQTIESTGFIDQSADTYINAEPKIDAIVAATGAENQALVLDNLGSAITGNASNDSTLEVSVAYRIVQI